MTFSDHRLVVARFNFSNIHLCFKRHTRPNASFNIAELTSNKDMQHKYHHALEKHLSAMSPSDDPNADLQELFSCVRNAAHESVGPRP